MTDRRTLIIGAGGQLGTAFRGLLENAVSITRQELDLVTASEDEILRLLRWHRPAYVINCAAYTNVDQAESEESLATEINGHAVGRLAGLCRVEGMRFVTYSTDYVFSGDGTRPYVESDPTDPVNAYGRSKLAGEGAALEANDSALIIRTSWVLSATHRNFVTAILTRAVRGEPLRVVNDQRGRPTIAADLACATLRALDRGVVGLLHLANEGEATWYELALEAVMKAGLDVSLVSPCATEDYPTPARRPRYSVLGSEVAADFALDPLPHWRSSIESVVVGSMRLIRSDA